MHVLPVVIECLPIIRFCNRYGAIIIDVRNVVGMLVPDFPGGHPAISGIPIDEDAPLRSESAVVIGYRYNLSVAIGIYISHQWIFVPGA